MLSAIEKHISDYISHLEHVMRLSHNTIKAYSSDLRQFMDFLYEYDPDMSVEEIDRKTILYFIAHLRDRSIGSSSLRRKISALKRFHDFLRKREYVDGFIFNAITKPKVPATLPKFITSVEGIKRLLSAVDKYKTVNNDEVDNALKSRDRCIIQLLYGLGLRSMELVALNLEDIDDERIVHIRKGKGNKERLIPLGNKTQYYLNDYLKYRSLLLISGKSHNPALLLTVRGGRISTRRIRQLIKQYVVLAGMEDVSPHTLRHTFATHILGGGASLRDIQELLGHSSIDTTSIYTHITLKDLKEKYERAHPHARSKINNGE